MVTNYTMEKKMYTILIVLFVILISTIVRFYPIINYSPEPVHYAGGGEYSLEYVLKTGHFLSEKEAKSLIGASVFAQGIIEYAIYPFFPTYYVSMLVLCNIQPSTWECRLILSLLLALPVLLICFCIFNLLSKSNNTENYSTTKKILWYLMVIILYSQLASPVVITQLGAPGWLFMLFPIYILFFKDTNDPRLKFISIIFLSSLSLAYFTAASFFLLWIFIVTLYLLIKRNSTRIRGIALIFVVVYLSYAIYVSTTRFMIFINIFQNFLDVIKTGFIGFKPTAVALPQNYLVYTSIYNKLKYIFNATFVAFPTLLFVLIRKKIFKKYPYAQAIIFSGLVVLPILVLLLFFWLGNLSIGRLPEYGSIMSILAVTSMIPLLKKDWKRYIVLIAIFAIIFSVYTYVTDENIPYRRITYKEDISAKLLMSISSEDDVIFTDHRLSGVFIRHGFLKTTGIIEKRSVEYTIDEINAVYYGNDSVKAFEIIKGMGAKYTFFSLGMTKQAPAIYLFNYPVKHAPADFLLKYEKSQSFNKIYDNEYVVVYEVF